MLLCVGRVCLFECFGNSFACGFTWPDLPAFLGVLHALGCIAFLCFAWCLFIDYNVVWFVPVVCLVLNCLGCLLGLIIACSLIVGLLLFDECVGFEVCLFYFVVSWVLLVFALMLICCALDADLLLTLFRLVIIVN